MRSGDGADLGDSGAIVLTGAAGFIGSRLLHRLVEAGAEVHAVSRLPREGPPRVRWWQVDLADRAEVARLIASVKPDAIVHLASHVSGRPSLELVPVTLENNLVTTVNILSAAAEAGTARTLVTGTMVEPDGRLGSGIAGSPYAMAKWASSSYARMFHSLYSLPVVILRVYMVYGPGQEDPSKLIPHTILSLLRGEAPRVSSGSWELDWVYVDDVVDAYLAALRAPGLEGETLDVGSGELESMRDVLLKIAELVGTSVRPEFGAVEDRPLETPRRANVEETSRLLGWTPTTSLEEGLRRTIDWYRERQGTIAAHR
jgi:UDP-glucose 4-epimerase